MSGKRLKLTFAELLATQTVIVNNLYPREPKLLGGIPYFFEKSGARSLSNNSSFFCGPDAPRKPPRKADWRSILEGGIPVLRIAIVANDVNADEQMQTFIHRYARSEGLEVFLDEFDRADKFLSRYKPIYDIVFMEIELPGLNGMDAAKRLRSMDSNVVLVFVTAFARYAIRGYEVDALDFVLKPLNYYAFSLKLERAIQRAHQRTEEQIVLKTSNGVLRLEIRQIFYLETKSRMLYYHTATGVYSVRSSLQSAEQMLMAYSFAKCNQCYLVNLQHVTDVRDDYVVVAGTKLEISRRNRKTFLDAVVAYIGGV